MKKITEENKQVLKCGARFIGHFNIIENIVAFDNCSIVLPKKNLYELLSNIFDINSEDGYFLEDLKGKYCRILIDEKGRVIGFKHITKDKSFMLEEREQIWND